MRAILIGATGLTGHLLLQQLRLDPVFSSVKLISRRSAGIKDPRVTESLIDFTDEAAFRKEVTDADVLFCCIGTTQNKVRGDMDAYRKIDFDIPVRAAKFCAEQRIGKYIFMSSVGASAASKNFYLKLKGETEQAILTQPVGTIYIMRPSILLGQRNEFRLSETMGKGFMQIFSVLLFNGLSKYKAIHSKYVAKAMLAASKKAIPGKFICHYKEIIQLADKK